MTSKKMTLQIREGAFYIRRDGETTGRIEACGHKKYPFYDPKFNTTYTSAGMFWADARDAGDPGDLTSECNADGSPITEAMSLGGELADAFLARIEVGGGKRITELKAENARLLKENAALALAHHRLESLCPMEPAYSP